MFVSPKPDPGKGLVGTHDVALPAADELNRERSGLAVIGGLTPEVVGVGDFGLDLRRFRRLAVVDIGVISVSNCTVKVAWLGSLIEAATVKSC